MPLNVRFHGELAVLSNFGRLLNDPRHFDASRDVRELLDRGARQFVLELVGVRTLGPTALGLLMTLTRLIRQDGGDAALSGPGPDVEKELDAMRMDTYWEVFKDIEEAQAYFERASA